MNKEIPSFLIEMSKQLNEQDNRMTAYPMFEVRYKNHLATEEGYNESHWEILCDSGYTLYHSEKSESYDDLASYLYQNESDWCDAWIAYNDLSDVQVGEIVFTELFNEHFDPDIDDLPSDLKSYTCKKLKQLLTLTLQKRTR